MNNIIALILSAGGAAFLTALVTGLRSISATRMESEEALIKRLTSDAETARKDAVNARLDEEKQRLRAETAEEQAAVARNERDQALEARARYRLKLIQAGVNPDED